MMAEAVVDVLNSAPRNKREVWSQNQAGGESGRSSAASQLAKPATFPRLPHLRPAALYHRLRLRADDGASVAAESCSRVDRSRGCWPSSNEPDTASLQTLLKSNKTNDELSTSAFPGDLDAFADGEESAGFLRRVIQPARQPPWRGLCRYDVGAHQHPRIYFELIESPCEYFLTTHRGLIGIRVPDALERQRKVTPNTIPPVPSVLLLWAEDGVRGSSQDSVKESHHGTAIAKASHAADFLKVGSRLRARWPDVATNCSSFESQARREPRAGR